MKKKKNDHVTPEASAAGAALARARVATQSPKRRSESAANAASSAMGQAAGEMTFGVLMEDFERAYMPKLAMPTRSKYASLIRVHVRPDLGSVELADLNTRRVDSWLAGKCSAGLAWATRADLRNLVCSIFTRAQRWEVYEGKNPARLASPGRKCSVYEKRKMTILQTVSLLKKLPADVRIVCMVALFCGLRISEVLGLCWKHVDFERGMFLIRQRYYRGDLDRTKTESSDRDVPFGRLDKLLRQLRPARQSGERFCFQVVTCKGITRDDSSIRRYFLKPAAEKLGIDYPGFGFHAFRREAVTAIAGKAGAIQACRVAGHTRMDVTLLYGLDDYAKQTRAIRSIQTPFMTAGLLGVAAK